MEDFVRVVFMAVLFRRRRHIGVALAKRIVDLIQDPAKRTVRAVTEPKRDRGELIESVPREGDQPDRATIELYAAIFELLLRPGPKRGIFTRAMVFPVEREQT